jgi:hypothetical protein
LEYLARLLKIFKSVIWDAACGVLVSRINILSDAYKILKKDDMPLANDVTG